MMTAIDNNLIDDLKWRGLIAQTTDEAALREALKKPITLYLGTDPTAPSIHVGNLVPLLVMRRFQLAGHNPILLVGGATGLVGDPSGRNDERSLNDSAIVEQWVNRIKVQLSKFMDFDTKHNPATMANNLDWTAPLSTIAFLRDIGKHFSVNQMLNKDAVSSRLEKDGISYTEFSYQVLQAMDYLELYRRYNCTLQIGGSDQWGNITAGCELIRRVDGGLKIQLIPATRIGNPNALGAESDNYFQGVIVDEFGKPVAYRIYRVTREGVYFGAEDIAAENFTHYFDPFRIDQMRGIIASDGVAVEQFDLPHDMGPEYCLHLMSVISPIREDLAVVRSRGSGRSRTSCPSIRILPEVASTRRGSSIARVASGPMPGSTPISVPSRQPMKA